MITFYCTSSYWDDDDSEILDLKEYSEKELAELLNKHPNGLIKVSPHREKSEFKRIFMRLTDGGYPIEGVYDTILCGVNVKYRLLENINMKRIRRIDGIL